MANSGAVWGIDLGHCALKALRCRPHEKDDNRLVVEAFDYIEYPKILTQPEANREELIQEALAQFVSRNSLIGDSVAISVPGQSGLARFIKLPPVEAKKIPDIVKYEARQQIPFALEDVVWDYQPLAGGSIEDGYALETEIGLFAMKRDQVARHLKPLEDAGIGVDLIQLAPLAIYNFVCFDQLGDLTNYDRDNPPLSKVVMSLGTDTTDLVITDGFRIWQRSIPIGGNHFTKALTKELKLTFAKAEHLKRNAMKAENPKAVFQAMRPVFSDLVAEIQRSIGFFTSNNRNAKLGTVIALGNPLKLPGLQRYLSQNLDQEVTSIDEFKALVGGSVTAVPQFKENQLTFGVAYGLCVQALDKSQLHTNLLPMEIVTKRLVAAKKPWMVAAAAMLLIGLTVNYASHYASWRSAAVDTPEMKQQISASKQQKTWADEFTSKHAALIGDFDAQVLTRQKLVSNVEGRLLWLELLKAIDTALPKDTRPPDQRKETAEDVTARPELHITSVDCEYFDDLSLWYTANARLFEEAKHSTSRIKPTAPAAAAAPAADAAAPAGQDGTPADPAAAPAATPEGQIAAVPAGSPADAGAAAGGAPAEGAPAGISGPGWVLQLKGYHFHNTYPGKPDLNFTNNEGKEFIENTFFKELEEGKVELPDGPNGTMVEVPIAKLGIGFPVVTTENSIVSVTYLPDSTEGSTPGSPVASGRMSMGDRGPSAGSHDPSIPEIKSWPLRKYDFTIQFVWTKKTRSQRAEKPAGDGGEAAPGTASAAGAGAPAG